MSRPLRSAPVTGASPLLRAGPPAGSASVLCTPRFLSPGALPLATRNPPQLTAASTRRYRNPPSYVPCRSRRTGSRHLYAGHRLASKRDTRQAHPGIALVTPVLMSLLPNGTSSAVHLRSPSCPLPDASHDAFSPSLSTTSLQLMHHEVV